MVTSVSPPNALNLRNLVLAIISFRESRPFDEEDLAARLQKSAEHYQRLGQLFSVQTLDPTGGGKTTPLDRIFSFFEMSHILCDTGNFQTVYLTHLGNKEAESKLKKYQPTTRRAITSLAHQVWG